MTCSENESEPSFKHTATVLLLAPAKITSVLPDPDTSTAKTEKAWVAVEEIMFSLKLSDPSFSNHETMLFP